MGILAKDDRAAITDDKKTQSVSLLEGRFNTVEGLEAACQAINEKITGSAALSGLNKVERDTLFHGTVLVTTEALINAFKHGNAKDPLKSVSYSLCEVSPDGMAAQFILSIKDQGKGFEPVKVANCLEGTDIPSGRGVLFYCVYAQKVEFSESGTKVGLTFDAYKTGDPRWEKLLGERLDPDGRRYVFVDGKEIELWAKSPLEFAGATAGCESIAIGSHYRDTLFGSESDQD